MSIKDLIAAAMTKNATDFESAFTTVMGDKVASALDTKFGVQEEEADEEEVTESFKRGDVIHVPGGEGTKHPAVHLGNGKAVYLDDDGAVDHVPAEALAKAMKAAKVPAKHKELASKYLANMKEESDLDEESDEDEAAKKKKEQAKAAAGRMAAELFAKVKTKK